MVGDEREARAAQRCRQLTTALYRVGRAFQGEYERLKAQRGLLDLLIGLVPRLRPARYFALHVCVNTVCVAFAWRDALEDGRDRGQDQSPAG